MNIATLKQALEALQYGYGAAISTAAFETIQKAEQALRAAIEQAEKAGPVAWRWTWKTSRDQDGYCYTHTYPSQPKLMDIEALYTHPAPVPAWQPIETAPKDGTRIVVANKCGSWIAEYRPVYQSGFKPRNPWQSMMLNHDHMTAGWAKRDYLPTHWMPLPAAPKPGEMK